MHEQDVHVQYVHVQYVHVQDVHIQDVHLQNVNAHTFLDMHICIYLISFCNQATPLIRTFYLSHISGLNRGILLCMY